MVIKPFKLFILLILLFSVIRAQSNDVTTINIDGDEISESGQDSKTYLLEFTTAGAKYAHIKITPTTESTIIVYTSKRDSQCKKQRNSLAKNPNGPINLFLKETKGGQEYLCVQCLGDQSCEYDIDIKLTDKCYLPIGEQYNYYVNDFIESMEFEFEYDSDYSLRKLTSSENIRVNFWVKGQNKPEATFDFGNLEKEESDFTFGKISSAEFDGNGKYGIKVNAKKGDYITVGSLYIEKNVGNELEINYLEFMGMLTKNDEEICFPIKYDSEITETDELRLDGNIYPLKAQTYLKLNGITDENSKEDIENGIIQKIIYGFEINKIQFCISNNNSEKIIFSLQLTLPSFYKYNQFIYPPHLPGVIYTHYLQRGEIAVFQGREPNKEAKEINFNMKVRKGFPNMHFDRCSDYPNCEYDENSSYYKNPHHSNRMITYSFYLNEEEEYTTISPFQPLMIVECLEGKSKEDNTFFCEFETSIFTDKDRLYLVESQTFSQYLLKNEKDLYTIIVPPNQNIIQVNLELTVYSGDVDFENIQNKGTEKNYLSNKIISTIPIKSGDTTIDFNVKAQNNSFYLIAFYYIYKENVDEEIYIESGVNYIQTIDVNSYKYFNFENMGFSKSTPFLISFFSQNCHFNISRTIYDDDYNEQLEEVPIHDSYSQTIIDIDDTNFYTGKQRFKVNINENDKLKKDCLLYISSLEIVNTHEGKENYISVSEGVTQLFIFTNKYYMIKYAFHVSNFEKAVIIGFNLIDKTSYNVQIFFGYDKYTTVNIFRNDQIFLLPQILEDNCLEKDEVCTININIELENPSDEISSKLETTFYQVNGAPIYLEKNAVKQDILFGNEKKYYYFDVEKNEVGDITIDYKRGSGNIYAKVVNKNVKDDNPNWRGMYQFLNEKGGLEYDPYLKIIDINLDDTDECDDGCYILLTVENSVPIDNPKKDEKKALTPLRISIIPRIILSDYYLDENFVPKVKIKVDDFVIGNLFPTNRDILEYFEVNLPFDSDIVYIDWQADKSSLLVNIGEEKPKIDQKDFIFERKGFDTLFKMTKEEILNKLYKKDGSRKDTLKNIHLTLGIYNEKMDSLYTSVYAFKIFMSEIIEESFSLVHIRSDQKVQCEPFEYKNKYACAFAVLFDEGDNENNLIVYPRTLNEKAELSYEGSLVNAAVIEKNDITEVYNYFKNMNKDYSSDNGKKFMYIENINRSKSLIFLVYTDIKANIEVLSSTYKFSNNQVFIPNPSTAQIFALGKNSIEFDFETIRDFLVNIVSLEGEGEFYWDTVEEENTKYYLNGYEDRLTLTTKSTIAKNQTHLRVVSKTTTQDKSGFVFYMTFYPRNDQYNIDQLKVGRSIELNYREAKFPLNYFSPISNEEITISFTFYNYYKDSYEKLTYDKELYNIWAKILSEEEAYRATIDKDHRPTKTGDFISGTADGPFALLSLTSKDLNELNINNIENPTLFLAVELEKGVQNDFKRLGVEISISKENSLEYVDYFVSENVYYNDKLSNKNNPSKYIYKLRADRNKPYMRIEFASNNDDITMSLAYSKNPNASPKILKNNYEYGRYIYIVQNEKLDDYIYLTVSSKKANENPQLTNYIFKYNNAEKNNFNSFQPKEDDLTLENSYGYSISFSPVEHNDVSYFIKGLYKNNIIEGEKIDTIAMSDSQGFYIQLDNPEKDTNGKIKADFGNIKEKISYIKVLAKVNDDANKEFLLYKPLIVQDEEVEPDEIKPSENLINLEYDLENNRYIGKAVNAYKIQRYSLNFKNVNNIPEYIKFELSSNDKTNKVISFTPNDKMGKTDRIQLAQLGTEDNVEIWIKKDQLDKNKEYFYIVIECQNKGCNYLMDITGEENIEFNSPNFNYNFYVNEKNKQMTFKILNENSDSNKNQILSLYATGGKPITINVKTSKGENFSGQDILVGQALTTYINSFSYFYLTITAEEGDYISLGSKLIIDKKSDVNVLKSNGYQLTGLLKKNIIAEECYSIDESIIDKTKTAIIVGLFYNKEGTISLKDKNSIEIVKEQVSNIKGYFTYNYVPENKEIKYICISIPNEDAEDLAYTLQLTQPSKQYGFPNLFVPQSNGNIYPRILDKGSYSFFNGINLNSNSEEIIYNMLAKKGLPTMYIYKCDNYPLCEFDERNDDIIKINDINLMSTWHNKEKNSPIDASQYIMFVKCEDLHDNNQVDICEFYTSIYGNLDKIFLIEGKTFSQYILKEQNSHYYIDISGEEQVDEIQLDILIINGDISLELKNAATNKNIDSDKYILSNKIFYSIPLNKNYNLKRVEANIVAKMNSYYIIEYKLIRKSDDEYTNDIYTGINYLIPIKKDDTENEKTIKIHSTKLLKDETYYISFYSLNCKLEINRVKDNGVYEQIQSYGNYGEEIIENEEISEEEKVYTYKIKLKENYQTRYNNDMCMVYVNSIELMEENNDFAQKEILVTEGIPQRIHFTKIEHKFKYIYPNINKDKEVNIYFNVINSANYTYTITYNHNKTETGYFSQSKLLYVNENKINENCEKDYLCNIIVSIGVVEEIKDDKNNPILEISIREIGNIPYYLPKGVAKKDFISGTNKLNLFTTLGSKDQGFVTVDFARGSGMIYAKIVPIDGEGDNNPEWRQYKLPSSEDNTLPYDFYNKKVSFETKDTEKCKNGCYFLISIESSTSGSFDDNLRSFQLSITVNLIPNGELKKNGTIIQIQPEQYIIGSLADQVKMKNQDMYEFYQLNIPFNAKKVEIDWQSDSTILLLNIGKERPLINNNFKKFESRSDTVFETEIEGSVNNDNNNYLTIGVYSEILESPYGNSYSFRVRFKKDLNIYKVDSDQKTLCKPEKIQNNEFRCLFMVIYEEFDFIYDTLVYAKSQSNSASTYMYGEFIDNKIYDNFDEDSLNKKIPGEDNNSKYNTKRDKIDFIFVTLPPSDSHFYVSVISDKSDIIEFISSFKTFDNQLSPNPSSVQLFAVNNDPSINLKFQITKPLLINIVSLYGSIKMHFKDDDKVEYFIRGRDDRISLAIPNDGNEENLIIENINYNEEERYNNETNQEAEKPGIAFYLEYYLRTENLNLDEISLGKTSEIVYKKSDFPIYYYSKINNLDDINIFFNFHDLKFNSTNGFIKINPNDLSIKAKIVSQTTIYNIKTGAQSKINNDDALEGKYDPALQAGYLFLSSDDLKKFNNVNNQTLYLSFEKRNDNNKFTKIGLELTAFEKKSEIPVTEKIYQYGNIKKNEVVSYKLKVDNSTGDMRIQFAANSKNVKFAINKSPNEKKNISLINEEIKEERGKLFVTFKKPECEYIYLNVFAEDDKKDSRLNNYAFKYINSNDRKNFLEYKILDNNKKILKTFKNSVLTVKFNRIDNKNVDVTYSLKVAKKDDKIQDEIADTIAFTANSPTVVQTYNPSGDGIIMKYEDLDFDSKNLDYIEIIAQIKDGPIIEYEAYESVDDIKNDDINDNDKPIGDDDDDDDDKEVIIAIVASIGSAILIILIALIVIIFIYNRKTKDLLQQVNKISFADADSKDKNENLLLDDNELK